MTTRPPEGRPYGRQPLNPADAYQGTPGASRSVTRDGGPLHTTGGSVTPEQQHAHVLDRLATTRGHFAALGFAYDSQVAAVDGRQRIVERHAPLPCHAGPECAHCTGLTVGEDTVAWPCDDYRDAAADLLPTEATA